MKLGTHEGVSLITTLIVTKALISAPVLYIKHSLSAGWLEVLISGIIEIAVLILLVKLLNKFEYRDVLDIADIAFGKCGKVLVGATSWLVIIISSAAVCRSFAELIRNTIIRDTSYESVLFFILVAATVGARLGLKPQANVNNLILPCIFTTIFIIIIINFSRYSTDNIQPIMGTGAVKIFENALFKNATFFELGIILFITPFLGNKNDVKRISFTALLLSISLITVITLTYQLAVPFESAKTFANPLYQMTRMLKAGTFFQRIEPLNVFLWGGAMYIYCSVGIYLASHVCKKTFSLSDEKGVIYIISLIIGLLALLPGSETSVEKIYNFLMTYSYIAYPIAPLILLIIASMVLNIKKIRN